MTNPFAQLGIGVIGNAVANPYYAQQAQGQLTNSQYYAQQAQAAQAFAQYAQQEVEKKNWMIDGVSMTFKQFADEMYPEDSPERTMFFLKYSQ